MMQTLSSGREISLALILCDTPGTAKNVYAQKNF
jgi:hypothetical protein